MLCLSVLANWGKYAEDLASETAVTVFCEVVYFSLVQNSG